MRKYLLVTYDVKTDTKEGRSRLRKVAKICQNYGQRVQWSVFECSVNGMQLEQMRKQLLDVIAPDDDSLRIYHLGSSHDASVESHGVNRYVDFADPLIV